MPIAGLGPWELIIILLIVVVIFGAGRLSEIGGAVGRSVREFRSATRDENKDKEAAAAASQATVAAPPPPPQPVAPVQPVAAAPVAVAAPPAPAPADTKCPSCGTVNPPTQAFCGQCGTRLTRAA